MTTRTPPQHIKHQQAEDRHAALRGELVRFAGWLLQKDVIEHAEEQIVDEYLSTHQEAK